MYMYYYVYLCVFVYAYIYITHMYIYIYIHTHTHIMTYASLAHIARSRGTDDAVRRRLAESADFLADCDLVW